MINQVGPEKWATRADERRKGETHAIGGESFSYLQRIRTFRAFRSMSSSEQLTLGAKLCAILIRHLRYLSLFLSLVGAHFTPRTPFQRYHDTLVVFMFPFPATAYYYLSLSLSFPFALPLLTARRLRTRRTYKGGERKERRNNAALRRLHQHYGDTRSMEEHREHRREQRITQGKGRRGEERKRRRRTRRREGSWPNGVTDYARRLRERLSNRGDTRDDNFAG